MFNEWETIMCYADTTTEDDGTVTAHCYCGWVQYGHATQQSADDAAYAHQNASDDTDGDMTDTAIA